MLGMFLAASNPNTKNSLNKQRHIFLICFHDDDDGHHCFRDPEILRPTSQLSVQKEGGNEPQVPFIRKIGIFLKVPC